MSWMKPHVHNSTVLLFALLLDASVRASAADKVSPQPAPPAAGPSASAPAQRTTAGVIKVSLSDAPIVIPIELVSRWLGASEVLIEPTVLSVPAKLNLTIDRLSTESAVGVLRDALNGQANVRYEELPEGVLHFAPRLATGSPLPLDRSDVTVYYLNYAKVAPDVILRRMKAWSGKEIHADATVLTGEKTISLHRERTWKLDGSITMPPPPEISREIAFALARTELEKQAGMVLDEQPDGSYRARLLSSTAVSPPSIVPQKQP